MSDPPAPLFGRPPFKKKFEGLFCGLGPKEHFWFNKSVHFLSRPEIKLPESDQIDQISPPPIIKHVFAPQNDFGMPKITWSNHKSFGIEEIPPPPVGKNSQIIPYILSERLPNMIIASGHFRLFVRNFSNFYSV